MIDAEKRKAVYLLHKEGMSVRELARRLDLSRNTVREIIEQSGALSIKRRSDRKLVDEAKLTKLHADCKGFVQRMHEKLMEEDGLDLGYSTLTRLVRELGLGVVEETRDAKVPDEPGLEMQHDTSPYDLLINGQKTRVIGSSLYLRYSKIRYLKFSPAFNRFRMKCFFNEALGHFKYAASVCIIDNTNLAVLRGSGANAVMVPEMIAFAKQYGFNWKAHAINHSDRKGGVERGFWYVETNFFPGRTFQSIEDLNAQAFAWATMRIPLKPHAKSKLIPAQLFEFEKAFLKEIPPFVSNAFLSHDRETDQYGYVAFEGNFFWIPGSGRGAVQVLQYSEKIKILRNREVVAEYSLPPWGTKNERIKPKGVPEHQGPRNCKKPTGAEENRLRSMAPEVGEYLDLLKKAPDSAMKKYRLIRQVFRLSQKLSAELFLRTIQRALTYRVTDMETIERMAVYLLRENAVQRHLWPDSDEDPKVEVHYEVDVSDLPDLGKYDAWLEMNDDEEGDQNGEGT